MPWFQLIASGNPLERNDYNIIGGPSCSGPNHICAIQAIANASNKPIITQALKDEMLLALHYRNSSTNVQLRTNP